MFDSGKNNKQHNHHRTRRQRDRGRRRVLLRGPPRRQQRRAPARQLHRRARKMNDCVRDEIWVTVPRDIQPWGFR